MPMPICANRVGLSVSVNRLTANAHISSNSATAMIGMTGRNSSTSAERARFPSRSAHSNV